jgi:tRNA pseudouridine55 synthase
LLGKESPTEDTDGTVTELINPCVPTLSDILEAAKTLTGEIEQRPPAYSAIKVDGQRSYELARRGQAVELKPRRIVVHGLEVTDFSYPQLTLHIRCSSGTYVRSLGRDLAKSLGTAAVMSALVRTAVGSFHLEDAVDPNELGPEDWQECLLPPSRAVETLPRVELSEAELARVRTGRTVHRRIEPSETREWAAFDPNGRLVAILVPRGPGQLGPAKNL